MPVFKTGAINHSANSPRQVLSVLHHFSRSPAFAIQHALALFCTGRARLTVVPIYATRDAALAAEVCCEADTKNISCGHILCDFLYVAKNKTLRRRSVRKVVSENSIRLQPPEIVSTTCFRAHAGARAPVTHARSRHHAGTGDAID